MTFREKIADWLVGGDYSHLRLSHLECSMELGRQSARLASARRRVSGLEDALAGVVPNTNDRLPETGIAERFRYRGGTIADKPTSAQEVWFPGAGFGAHPQGDEVHLVGPDGFSFAKVRRELDAVKVVTRAYGFQDVMAGVQPGE